MFDLFRAGCERLLRIPPEPRPPAGHAGTARVFRAAPAYFRYQVFLWAIAITGFALVVGGIVFGVHAAIVSEYRAQPMPGSVRAVVYGVGAAVIFFLILHAGFTFAVLRLNYEKRWYVVTDRSLRVREGVMAIREMTVTFANIQNLAVMQGPIQRALGLADLKVETAGGGAMRAHQRRPGPDLHTAWFRGIDNAEEVKALIQQRLRELRDSGLGDHQESGGANLPAPTESADSLEALRAVHLEARALREAMPAPPAVC